MSADGIAWGRPTPANPRGRKGDFVDYMQYELRRVASARTDLERKWRQWMELYRPLQGMRQKNFPYEDAANFTYPFAMMSVNPILANEIQVLFATDNLWTTSPLSAPWVPVAKPLQDGLTYLQRHVLRMWQVVSRASLEKFKLGTAIYKTGWDWRQHRTTGYDRDLKRVRLLKTINRPFVDHVHLANFFIPPEALEIDPDVPGGALWVAEKYYRTANQLRAMANTSDGALFPRYDGKALATTLEQAQHTIDDREAQQRRLDRMGDAGPTFLNRRIELFEIHARFDTTGNGIDDDVVTLLHEPTGSVLQAMYQPYAHGKRPYHAERFLRGDGFYGIGVAEQAEVWQNIITEMLNNSIDKARLSNAPMLAFKEGANVLPNEAIYPTKLWPLQNPKDDLVPMFLTDNRGNYDFAQLIQFAIEAGNQHVGVSDVRRGNVASLPSRTPATTVQSMLQESNTLLDLSIKDARKGGLADVGLQVLQLLQQMDGNPRVNPDAGQYVELFAKVLGPDGALVERALRLPYEDIANGIGVELTATSGTNNKVMEQQKYIGILQLAAQIGPQVVGLVQAATQGGPVGASALGAAEGIIELFRRFLEQNDIKNLNDILPEEGVTQLLAMAQQQAGPMAQPAAPGGAPLPSFTQGARPFGGL